jgi:hypothetical protein
VEPPAFGAPPTGIPAMDGDGALGAEDSELPEDGVSPERSTVGAAAEPGCAERSEPRDTTPISATATMTVATADHHKRPGVPSPDHLAFNLVPSWRMFISGRRCRWSQCPQPG